MDPASGRGSRGETSEARLAIERFLAASLKPILIESGEEPIPVEPGNWALEWRSGYLVLQAWTDSRNVSRRVVAVREQRRDRLELTIERFGKRPGVMSLVDLHAPKNLERSRKASRIAYAETLRRAILRQFPGWRIAELSSEPNLEHSLSPSYPRAYLRKGTSAWAAIGAPPDAVDVNGILTFGLIWLDYLRARERRSVLEGLALFLPAGQVRVTCLRVKWLNERAAQFTVFAQTEDGYEDRVDLADYGNLDTRLERCTRVDLGSLAEQVAARDYIDHELRADGSVGLRVRGLEFARASTEGLVYGLETKRRATASNLEEVQTLARELNRMRSAETHDRLNPLYSASPERWLESQVRRSFSEVDATLLHEPVYGQVPQFTAGDRDVIDLLAVDCAGRLAVLELKTSEDVHLPMQALDYWMRAKWHADRNEFTPNGYFPGMELRRTPPRLLMVAPALDYHPANDTVLRYLSSDIEVARIGVGLEWRKQLKVMFRHGN